MAINNPWVPNYGAPQIYAAPVSAINNTTPSFNSGQMFYWVQGEQAAKSYQLYGANSRVYLMDTETPTIYMKSNDNTGRPLEMQIFDLVERTNAVAEPIAPVPTLTIDDVTAIVRKEIDEAFSKNRHYSKNRKEVNHE